MLTPSSQVVLRNIDLFQSGRWLLVNPTDPSIFTELADSDIAGFHQYYDQYQLAATASINANCPQWFGATIDQTGFDGAIVYLPKAKAHLDMLLDNLRDVVKPGGTIAVVGSNDAGIKSVGKQLNKHFGSSVKHDSARHCAMWCTTSTANVSPFSIERYLTIQEYDINSHRWPVASLPGVFSHGTLDAGTQLLLENLPLLQGKHALDFACGSGVIGAYIASRQPTISVTFSDVSALALKACEHTAAINGMDADIVASHGLGSVSKRFDHIVTNPPFHTGVDTDYEITERFIQAVPQHLTARGSLTLVANRFLPYPDAIQQYLHRHADLVRSNKFTVYSAAKK
ncbi:class I SAM-dependent methyltransferase [Alteromonas oceanisediminis]|uniref:class I SAM-dependent methyltransferase n=1 Tax=Alteromonas oceanisediminis TaxID=2836180 RepID=UPI001BD9F6E3|nr:class I SAM-dependent methyltransferase [Alteromonas oceanisediminis]MBT0586896.1 class I SAM-dependent methyltransferase [Alteromonas oceanisediminis]